MLQPRPFFQRRIVFQSSCCAFCSYRSFRTSTRYDENHIPRPTPGRGDFKPQPLGRPIGLPNPPKPGENTGIDTRTWRQRRADFFNHDKHLLKRQQLIKKVSTPYFREWNHMRHEKGKSFVAPPRLFRAERALYFPNLYGRTLAASKDINTTPVLQGKISVLSMFSSVWAEKQVETFVSKQDNPGLHEVLREGQGDIQAIDVNVEENPLKSWLIWLFIPSLRRRLPKERHNRYFLVDGGLTEELRDAIGLLNSKVGYVYLLDRDCKIRWAGSGIAQPEEKIGLVQGATKLLREGTKINIKQHGDLVPGVVRNKEEPVARLAAAAV